MTDDVLRVIDTRFAPVPGGFFSQGIIAEDLVITAGQTGVDVESGGLPSTFEGEVRTAFANLSAVLAGAGCSEQNVLKATCYLVDVSQFQVFDSIYSEFFSAPPPARSTVGVALAGELRFEVEAVALRNWVRS